MNKPIHDDFDESGLFARPASTGNPLQKYFRAPGVHVKLPSNGAYLPPGAIELTTAGEVPVYPMRAADELLMKSPDALMSGYALEQVLASCVPAIKIPKLIASPDLDVLLLAIRAASYGETMEIEASCPECNHDNTFECHLPGILATVQELPEQNPVRLSADVVAFLRPHNLVNATQLALAAFQETRKLQGMEGETDEARTKSLNESFKRLSELNVAITADCVMQIAVPEGTVTDRRAIYEFMNNVPRDWTSKIEARLKAINGMGMDKSFEVQCAKCEHVWKTEVEFDPTSFFDSGS